MLLTQMEEEEPLQEGQKEMKKPPKRRENKRLQRQRQRKRKMEKRKFFNLRRIWRTN